MVILPVIFSYEDVKGLFPHRKTYESFLARSLKDGRITQIRKGLYSPNDPSTGEAMAQRYQIACHLSPTAFLDYHLALEYYGISEQSFISEAAVSSLSRFRPFDFEGVTYRCIPVSSKEEILERMAEEGVRVVSKERLLIDCADRLDRAGGFEELAQAVSSLKEIDEARVLKLLLSRKEAFLFLKVGYILQKYYSYPLKKSFYQECLSYRSSKKYYLGTKPGLGVYVKEWNLIVPHSQEDAQNEAYGRSIKKQENGQL